MSASQPVDLTKAISYARQAGDAALMALAPADALRYYAQALDLYPQATEPDPSLALDLAIGLGTAQRQTGDPASRDTLIDAARRAADLGDTDRLVAAALANHRGFSSNSGVTDTDKIAVLELALDRLPADRPDRAEVLAALCAELGYGSTLKRRQNLADEAVAIALASDDDAAIVRVLNNVHQPLEVPPLHDQSLARTAEALDRAQRLGDPVLLFWAAQWRTETAARAGDIGEVDRCLDIAGSLAQRLDQPTLNWVHTITRSMRAQIAGDPDQAEGLGNEALQLGTDSGQPDAITVFGGDLWVVSLQRGTWNDLLPLLEQLVADAPGVAGLISGGLAVAHAQSDRSDQASRLLEEFAAAGFDLPMDQTWLATMACYAAAITEYGDERYAQTLFDRLVPWAKQLVTVGGAMAYGPVSHYLGGLATVVGRYDEAQNYFTQAATMSELMSDKFFTARTNLAWGKMFVERNAPGDADMARELLTKAHTAAATNGYAKVERRATEALRHLTEQ